MIPVAHILHYLKWGTTNSLLSNDEVTLTLNGNYTQVIHQFICLNKTKKLIVLPSGKKMHASFQI